MQQQLNIPSFLSIFSNRLNPRLSINTGFNLGNISVTPIKTTQSGSSDSLKALSPMVSNPSSPCTKSSVSNASTSGIVSKNMYSVIK